MRTVYCWHNSCFKSLLTKTLEIIYMTLKSISLILLVISIILINWSNLPIFLFLIFVAIIIIISIIFIFTIFVIFWRVKGYIKTIKKEKGIIFTTTNFVLMIFCIIICFIEQFSLFYQFHKVNFPCQYYKPESEPNKPESPSNSDRTDDKSNEDLCSGNKNKNLNINKIKNMEYLLVYIDFSYLEVSLMLGLWIMYILRKRIILEIDGPPLQQIPKKQIEEQYGKEFVVQPGPPVILEGKKNIGILNKYKYNNENNLEKSQNNQNQTNEIGVSHDLILQGKTN